MTVSVLVRVISDDLVPVPVSGVLVRVYNDLGGFVTEGLTGAVDPGEITFLLGGSVAGTVYTLRLAKDNHSFPPSPEKLISVHDPAVPPNEFEYTAHEGATAILATIMVSDDQLPSEPVEGVYTRIYDEDDNFLTEDVTDIAGELTVPLEGSPSGTTYIVRLRKDNYTVPAGATQNIEVIDPLPIGGTNIFDFVMHERTIPESADSRMCRVTGYLIDATGQPRANVKIRFINRKGFPDSSVGIMAQPAYPSIIDRRIIVADAVATSGTDGYVDVPLPRGGRFDVHVEGLEHPSGVISPVVIPDLSAARLEDILFPYVKSVLFSEDPIEVDAGGVAYVDMSILLSSGAYMEDDYDINNWLTFTPSDSSVATVVVSEGRLQVNGGLAGTTTIAVGRAEGALVPRSPSIPDLSVIDPTVEVL